MPDRESDDAATALFDLIVSHRITGTIYAAARLGVADCLADGPRSAAEVALLVKADERSVARLLRARVALGICRQAGPATYELTAIGAPLAAGAERSLKAYALLEGDMLWRGWGQFLDSVRTGKTGAQLAGVEDRFALMAGDPAAAKTFNDGMASITGVITPAILDAYDFGDIGHLMDVGGGFGEMLAAILSAYPSMRGSVFDLERCEAGARSRLAEAGLDDRSVFIAGDFFQSVPTGADAILMKSVIHDWNDEKSIRILRNCHKALSPGGPLLLVERLMPETVAADPEHLSHVLSDLNMLRGPGGAERTESEYRVLLGQSGFVSVRMIRAGRFAIIEARAG
jgi:SAM-dependent methyltransferase